MYKDFKKTFDDYLAASWTATPVKDFINQPPGPIRGYDPFIGYKTEFIEDETLTISEGPHCILQSIGIEFTVFVPSASGDVLAIDLSEQLKKLFMGKQLGNNITVISVDGPYFGVSGELESSGKWFKTTVDLYIEHRYFM